MLHAQASRHATSAPGRTMATRAVAGASAATIAGAALIGTAVLISAAAPAHATTTTTKQRAVVVKLTQELRATKDCSPLKVSTRLTKAAQGHANDMAAEGYFSHTSKDGRTWDTRIRNADWAKPAGENIASGFAAGKAVMKAWMNSPGHKRNILDCEFKSIGVGYTPSGHYWVQDFGY